MSARILIITGGPLCRNPRTVKEADALARAGYAVTVLHCGNHAPSAPLDLELMRGAPFQRVVAEGRSSGLNGFRRRLEVWAARKATTVLAWQTPRALGPVGTLLRQARRLPAALTIVHNEVAHAVGLRLHDAGRRVAADLEDWHSEDLLPAERRHRPLALLREQERRLLHELVHVTTPSHALADAVHARYGGRRPHVITNAFPLQPDPRTLRSGASGPPAFFWFSQRLGPGRGIEAFLSAWSRTSRPSRVMLLGDPSAGYREHLLAGVPAERRARIEFRGCVAPAALPTLIAEHDIGLALEERAIGSRDLTITNKILQYLNAGLAVVAADTAGQREVLSRSPEAGVLVDPEDAAGFAATLDELIRNDDERKRRQRAARQLAVDTYCWEHEAPRLVAQVASALETSTAA